MVDAEMAANGILLQDVPPNLEEKDVPTDDVADDREKEAIAKCKIVSFGIWKLRIKLNPVVFILSAAIIWALVIWCMIEPERANEAFSSSTQWITKVWTWLYIGSKDVGIVFLVVILFSKYSKLKLGKDSDKPEFSDVTYFTMLFACGIGIGIFYFSVAETIFHYEPGYYGNRYYNRYSDNQRAQDAINLTIFHWGIHGWAAYNFVGLITAFLCYRMGFPLSMRSCLYPIVGERIYGIIGDVIDVLSAICTIFAASTSLGLGVMQLNAGLNRLNAGISISTGSQIIIIWCVTAIATTSVVSGLKNGIKLLSQVCLGLGMIIMLVVLFTDNTWYLLNVFVQSIGHYFQNFISLGFQTDAFAQEGNAPDHKEAPDWMNDWTIFYWGWWVAYSPSVGMFTAKISRGRTVGEYIKFTMSVPVIYTFLWMCVFGGVGLRMERDAAIANITCSSPLGGTNATESYNGLYRLSCRSNDQMWFDVVGSYEGVGPLLSVLSVGSIILYFVTTSDSASLVTDSMASNGLQDTPTIQRVFWALTQGACATALLTAGGEQALRALQAASVAAGLPFTIVICFFYVSLWRAFQLETKRTAPDENSFHTDLVGTLVGARNFGRCLLAIFLPWYFIAMAKHKLDKTNKWILMITLASFFYLIILLLCLEAAVPNMAFVGLTIYVGLVFYVSSIRTEMRLHCCIEGNMAEDFFTVLLLYPCAAVQLHDHIFQAEFLKKNDESKSSISENA